MPGVGAGAGGLDAWDGMQIKGRIYPNIRYIQW